MMREQSFAALILTHGRPDRVHTYSTLRKDGYSGRIVLAIDNEDAKGPEYMQRFPGEVVVFDKAEVAKAVDVGDNFEGRRGVVYARNASFQIARDLGVRYFVQLDDDYVDFRHKRNARGEPIDKREIRDLDAVFDALLDFLRDVPALSVAMAQGGDFIGGTDSSSKRKAMNSFFCDVDRPFRFTGRINEDVNAYVTEGARGELFFNITDVALQQKATQQNAGGLTEIYLDVGTYVKSFYSVMYHPSGVKIHVLPTTNSRIYHRINWRATAPMILRESCRKPRPETEGSPS